MLVKCARVCALANNKCVCEPTHIDSFVCKCFAVPASQTVLAPLQLQEQKRTVQQRRPSTMLAKVVACKIHLCKNSPQTRPSDVDSDDDDVVLALQSRRRLFVLLIICALYFHGRLRAVAAAAAATAVLALFISLRLYESKPLHRDANHFRASYNCAHQSRRASRLSGADNRARARASCESKILCARSTQQKDAESLFFLLQFFFESKNLYTDEKSLSLKPSAFISNR